MNKIIIIATISALCFSACVNTSNNNNVVFDDSDIHQQGKSYAFTQTIETYRQFHDPVSISVVNDTLLLVYDTKGGGNVCFLLTTDGKRAGEFCRIGHGSGEMLAPQSPWVDKDGENIYIYDYKTTNTYKYNVADVLKGKTAPKLLRYNTENEYATQRFNNVQHISEDKMIGYGTDEKCRFLICENGQVKHVYKDFPILENDTEINRSIWGGSGLSALSLDGKHIVATTYIGGAFETFDVGDDGTITSRAIKAYYKPEYSIAEGAHPVCATATINSYHGFVGSLQTFDSSFISILNGQGPDNITCNTVVEYDYDGNMLNKYVIQGGYIWSMALDSQRNVYAFMQDSAGNITLKKGYFN